MSGRPDDPMLEWLHEREQRLARVALRHPVAVDLTLAGAIAIAALVGLRTQDRLGLVPGLFTAGLCAALLLHRRDAFLSFALVSAVAFAQWLLSVPQLGDAAVLLALYWVALESRSSRVAAAVITVEAGAVMAVARWVVVDPPKIWVGLSGLMVAAAGLGVSVRQRRTLLASLQERAAQLEQERDREGRLGAAAERARIAREMHDIVAHNLTVMIALADGASYAMESAPEQALPAMQRVSGTGREALAEMRRLLGVLRDEPSSHPLEPQPTIARLDELLARIETAGIPVSVKIQGDPHALGEGVQLAIFRVAQEALTNTLKHAVEPTRAELRLAVMGGVVELEVTDDGRVLAGVHAQANGSGGGRGLAGMRERAVAYDGTLQAGPRADGGWRVRLTLSAQ